MNGDIGIGKLIDKERERDAIHMAVASVVASCRLFVGQHIGIDDKGMATADNVEHIGIVDPFLPQHRIETGERFWMFLYPGSITSIRHDWTHPKLESTPDKAASEAWLRQYAVSVNSYLAEESEDSAYHTLMSDLAQGAITYHGIDMHGRDDLIDADELRHHAQIILGKPINYDSFEYFSCTC